MPFRGGTMWKGTSWGFRKCGSFIDLEVLNHSYRLSKSDQIQRIFCWEGGVTKKRHGHNIEFWGPPSNQRGPNMVGSTLIQWQRSKLIIVAVSFFCDASYFCLRSQNFTVFWLWAAITPVQKLTRPISSTFLESSGRSLSHGSILDIFFFEQISRNQCFMEKGRF